MKTECIELENIKYQTMLLNGNSKIDSNKTNNANINDILENEMKANKHKPWNKLAKNVKIKLLKDFSETYCDEKKYNETIKKNLINYLLKCLERKKLTKVKEIIYDSSSNNIKSIPMLTFDNIKNKFTLRSQSEKKKNTIKNKP
tara:strand:- start:111 stop:542 length:432 start_codon:yes stop_codon:yes gene_type:complete